MSMLIPPQMINTMEVEDLRADRVRRYMAPAFSDRQTEWSSHPMASRDSLHEADMWAVEGLTHRYPTKVLAELIPTCPQYCGHCTRMDLVGNDTLQVLKYKFETKQNERWEHDARLPSTHSTGARRRGLRRRHGERAGQAPGGLRDVAARHREHPRHPSRDEGAHGDPAALPAGRRARRVRSDGAAGVRPRRRHRLAHARELRTAGDAARRRGREDGAGVRLPRRTEPGRPATRREHLRRTICWSCASRSWITRRSCPTTSTCAT